MSKLWGIDDLAEYLGIPKATIYKWRSRNYGPPGKRVGKHIRYRPSDVEAWVTALPGGVS